MMDAYDISASAMSAQRLRLDIISSNLANMNTTRQADGVLGAYRRRNVVFAPLLQSELGGAGGGKGLSNTLPMKPASLMLDGSRQVTMDNGQVVLKAGISRVPHVPLSGVSVVAVDEDQDTPLRMVHDPGHPDAGPDGYVRYPNINPVVELVDMIAASRAYDANVTAFQSLKGLHKAALDI